VIPREIPREACLRLRTIAHVRALHAVIGPHLTDMSEHTDTPLDRTPLWTMDDLCAKLRVAKSTVHTWRKRGTAPRAYRIGRHLYFEDSDVRAWLAAHDADAVDGSDDSESGW